MDMTPMPEKPMRETLISAIGDMMEKDGNVFFLSADMGAPALDRVREDFKDRFINVGIAEQNMINVAAGLAMEGFTVFTYAIAPFYLRTIEQIRVNLALASQLRDMNVNMLALGAGFSYDVSGPTHHCLEDISIMRAMANVMTVSPGDGRAATALIGLAEAQRRPKYFRLDGKALPALYKDGGEIDFVRGFTHLRTGRRLCILATGVMVHRALKIAESFAGDVGVIDLFQLDHADDEALAETLAAYETVVTWEEGFIGRGGLDAMACLLISEKNLACRHRGFGMPNVFDFSPRNRFDMHAANGFGEEQVTGAVKTALA